MKSATPLELINYLAANGKEPFQEWLDSLDKESQARIIKRIKKIQRGLEGDWKSIDGQLIEYRFRKTGYRIYAIRNASSKRILLLGGDRGSQKRDIKTAKKWWLEFKNRE